MVEIDVNEKFTIQPSGCCSAHKHIDLIVAAMLFLSSVEASRSVQLSQPTKLEGQGSTLVRRRYLLFQP